MGYIGGEREGGKKEKYFIGEGKRKDATHTHVLESLRRLMIELRLFPEDLTETDFEFVFPDFRDFTSHFSLVIPDNHQDELLKHDHHIRYFLNPG